MASLSSLERGIRREVVDPGDAAHREAAPLGGRKVPEFGVEAAWAEEEPCVGEHTVAEMVPQHGGDRGTLLWYRDGSHGLYEALPDWTAAAAQWLAAVLYGTTPSTWVDDGVDRLITAG